MLLKTIIESHVISLQIFLSTFCSRFFFFFFYTSVNSNVKEISSSLSIRIFLCATLYQLEFLKRFLKKYGHYISVMRKYKFTCSICSNSQQHSKTLNCETTHIIHAATTQSTNSEWKTLSAVNLHNFHPNYVVSSVSLQNKYPILMRLQE